LGFIPSFDSSVAVFTHYQLTRHDVNLLCWWEGKRRGEDAVLQLVTEMNVTCYNAAHCEMSKWETD
jgi:hypothetical protein